tara:strand:- start:2795 stop:3031 length:237 start_codon:yes stop_codon:yes gene_type:complete
MTSKKEIIDMSDEKFMQLFDSLIEEVFDEVYSKSKTTSLYESIDDYTKKTGKRFRMTKEQKNKGLSREEAFKEFIESD